jgi:hypothetical protein
VENVEAMVSHLKARGVNPMKDFPRRGLEVDETFGLMTQLLDSATAGK